MNEKTLVAFEMIEKFVTEEFDTENTCIVFTSHNYRVLKSFVSIKYEMKKYKTFDYEKLAQCCDFLILHILLVK